METPHIHTALTGLGWNSTLQAALEESPPGNLQPLRVISHSGDYLLLGNGSAEFQGRSSGRLRRELEARGDGIVVGDWVLAGLHDSTARVAAVLPRTSCLTRAAAGRRTAAQLIAANVDYVCIVSGADRPLSAAGVERYLTLCWEGGSTPLLLLNKVDLLEDGGEELLAGYRSLGGGIQALATSALHDQVATTLAPWLAPGTTTLLVGPSGAGKSSLLNNILGKEVMDTGSVRTGDARGRHTTSRRQLFRVRDGGCLIDVPGLRETGLWSGEQGLSAVFPAIEALAEHCRFRDCGHSHEPGCAVLAALQDGNLAVEEYESYLKQMRELDFMASRQDEKSRREREQRWKTIKKDLRQFYKAHPERKK